MLGSLISLLYGPKDFLASTIKIILLISRNSKVPILLKLSATSPYLAEALLFESRGLPGEAVSCPELLGDLRFRLPALHCGW